MSDESEAIAGDAFWLKRATVLISGSLTELNGQAVRLSTAVSWFWSLYLAVVTTWSLVNSSLPWLMIVPVITLMLAYLACLFAQLPVAAEFDPRSPPEVEIVQQRMVVVKARRLMLVFVLLLLSAVSIAVALAVAVGL